MIQMKIEGRLLMKFQDRSLWIRSKDHQHLWSRMLIEIQVQVISKSWFQQIQRRRNKRWFKWPNKRWLIL
jgi:hypothetical protein